MPYNYKLFELEIVSWGYNCILKIIIISYSKPYNHVQTNDNY